MRRYALASAVVLSIGLSVWLGMASAAPAPKDQPLPKWEYKVLVLEPTEKPDAWEKRLGELGADGWEAVSVCHQEYMGGGTTNFKVILKRAK